MITLPFARWFSEYRANAIVEDEYKMRLGAKNNAEYSFLLQQQGLPMVSRDRFVVPNLHVRESENGQWIRDRWYCNGCKDNAHPVHPQTVTVPVPGR